MKCHLLENILSIRYKIQIQILSDFFQLNKKHEILNTINT